MRLVRFGPPGRERPGVVVADGAVLDVSAAVEDFGPDFFAAGGLDRLREVLGEQAQAFPRVALEEVRIGPPIARPHKIVCIGLNYADHAAESGVPVPEEPVVFFKATNTIVGPFDDVLLPRGGEKVDWEVELGIVVGSPCRYLPDEEGARSAIAGYCISNDVSERNFQLERGGQWVKGKSCETFNPLGPWLVTADDIRDASGMTMTLRLNGELMQNGNTKTMIFSPSYLVWYVSQFMVLEPGDLVNTGTPPGVGLGMSPPRYLREGDVMELSIDGLGLQRQVCRRAP